MAANIYDFTVTTIDGKSKSLGDYRGKPLLIVNVASRCGYTPQYKPLEELQQAYGSKVSVLGFPANEFGAQEPGTNDEIKEFCTSRYNVSFDMFAKVKVKGDGIEPLYAFLQDKATNPACGGEIAWNFTKFLIDANGLPAQRFESKVDPMSAEVKTAIDSLL